LALGFNITVGIIHDHSGQLRPLTPQQQGILDEILRLRKGIFSFARYDHFQANLTRGLPNNWHCRAGSRYQYICENGLVHWCSQQCGYLGIALEEYSREHLEREYHTSKKCAPYCKGLLCTPGGHAGRDPRNASRGNARRFRRATGPELAPPSAGAHQTPRLAVRE
jgi:hypothetical protein